MKLPSPSPAAPGRQHRLLLMLLTPMLATLFALAVFEAGFQFLYHDQSLPYHHRIPDPVLGWQLQPGARFTYSGEDFRARVEYSAQGWRDSEYSQAKPQGSRRTLVLGDSYMEGYTVDLQQSFHRQLQQLLAVRQPAAEVINFGVGGYGTLQSYLAFEHFGQDLEAELVLLGMFLGNDISNNSMTLEKRRWPASSAKVTSRPFLLPGAKDEWQITTADYQGALERYQRATASRQQQPWWRASGVYWLYDLARQLWWTWHASGASPAAAKPHQEMPACGDNADYDQAWQTTARILARLNQQVRSSGARLLVFTVPIAGGDQSAIVALKDRDQPRHQCRDAAAVERLRTILSDHEIPLLELGPAFAAASQHDPNALLVPSEGHWNAQGHRLAAEQVHRELEKLGLID